MSDDLDRFHGFVGKRRDGQGWDYLLKVDGALRIFGPYRLRREAFTAMSVGDQSRLIEEPAV
jgi:hypothetical protein